MSLPTCEVAVRCYAQDGQPDPGAVVTARLNHAEVYLGYVVPDEEVAVADAAGLATLTLFRNALGSTGSAYKVTIEGTSGQRVKVLAVVPDQATANLEDIATLPPYPGKPDGQLALDAAVEAQASAEAAQSAVALSIANRFTDYAAMRLYTGEATSAYVTGYLVTAAPGGIAGWFTRDDSDTTTADNDGTVIVDALGRRWKRRIDGAVNILWFIPPAEHPGILDESSTYDCSPAIRTALDSVFAGAPYSVLTGTDDDGNTVTRAPSGNWYFSGAEVYFPAGRYRCLSTIVIDRQCKLVGTSSGLPQGSGSKLSFPGGVPGIIVNNFDTDGLSTDPVANGGQYPTPVSGNATVIDGLSLFADTINRFRSEPSTADDLIAFPHGHAVFLQNGPPSGGFYETEADGNIEAHGIRIRGMCLLRNFWVFGFEGSGIYLNCTFSIPTGLEHGNGNLFRLEGVGCVRNAQHGIFIEGGDSNAGSGYNINVTQNGKVGIYDSSFLGNTWIACHANSNYGGDYKTDNVNASSLFLNCYSEAGIAPSSFAIGTLVVGGALGGGIEPTGLRMIQAGGVSGVRMYGGTEVASLSIGLQGLGDHNTPRTTGWALRWADTTAVEGSTSFWSLNRELGRLVLQHANVGGVLSFLDAGQTVANGYAREYVDSPGTNVGQMLLGTHFFGGKTEMRYRGLASAVPTVGQYLQGDVVWNSLPTAGGVLGWVCTTSGAAGSTAVFKTFGGIAA